jgi:hypothetical protein
MKYHTKETAMNMCEYLIWRLESSFLDEKEMLKTELELLCWQHFLKSFERKSK